MSKRIKVRCLDCGATFGTNVFENGFCPICKRSGIKLNTELIIEKPIKSYQEQNRSRIKELENCVKQHGTRIKRLELYVERIMNGASFTSFFDTAERLKKERNGK